MSIRTTPTRRVLLPVTALLSLFEGAHAQALPSDPEQETQRVTITGSNVRRADIASPSPVQSLTADDLMRSGFTTLSQALRNITANGQGTLSQSFPGAAASGSSGMSLRGLTVGSTLVLIDGHRMAPYPIGDDGQRSFVDLSSIPLEVVDRVEILKDGASAVYGSDAIAGVVNIILKRSYAGASLKADFGTSWKGDGNTTHLSGIWGFGDLHSDGRSGYVAAEFRKQSPILFSQRGGFYTHTDFTSTGGYDVTGGIPNALNGGLPDSATGYVTDASGKILGFMPGCDAAKLASRQCGYSNSWSKIQPPTANYDLVGRYAQQWGPDWQMSLQATFFESRSQQIRRPSTTFTGGYQGVSSGPGIVPSVLPATAATSISATNPSFPAGTGASSGLLHYTFLDIGPNRTDSDARSTRFVADLAGSVGPWNMSAAAGLTEVRLRLEAHGNVDSTNLQTALDSSTAPYLVGRTNSREVMDFVAPILVANDLSTLDFVQATGTRDLAVMAGGPLSLAVGTEAVHRFQRALAPDAVAAGRVDSFSNGFAVGGQTVASAHAELVAPFSKTLEVEAALRYDHYTLSGGRTSPKLGAKWMPSSEIAFRGTLSRGFRAPGPAENGSAGVTYVASTRSDPVLCKDSGNPGAVGNFPSQCVIQVPTAQKSNPGLRPETSKSATLGVLLQPIKDIEVSLDFYWIALANQIISGSSQDAIRGTNFSALPQVQPDGTTALVTPPVAPIAYYSVGYVNANRTMTNGVDVEVRFSHRLAQGVDYRSDFTLSFMNRYDLTVDGITSHLAGTHGPLVVSGDTGNPRTRVHWTHTLSAGPWSMTGTISRISAFDLTDRSIGVTDCASGLTVGVGSSAYASQLGNGVVPDGVKCRVGSFTTLDLWSSYDWSSRLRLHASILNVLNAPAPMDWGTYGGSGAPYNPAFHSQGAIGRFLSVGAEWQF